MAVNKNSRNKQKNSKIKGFIYNAGEIIEEKIADTLKNNYMPYAMSVIMSRAIPEIDGFKPSHRKLLYTMFKMGLLGSTRTKSANIVGQTMKLNPHGDSAIYDTMVRLSRGYEALLHAYVDSKGNFGKFYSRDMACAASRYTEAKLEEICTELFKDIEKNTVDFVDNYDNTLKEPLLLPCTFPSILVNSNTGIAVGMASSIPPFNLKEVCKTTVNLIKNPNHNILSTLIAPDFQGSGEIIYDKEKLKVIYETGRGGIKVRSKYSYDNKDNCIDITAIPPTTTSEAIIEKIAELMKSGKLRELSDVRDETGLEGLRITLDLKRGIDPDKLMRKLFKITPLEDTFSCNFNILISGVPKVMGVKEIIGNWVKFREKCVRRRTLFDLTREKEKLHLLEGLKMILVDIDKAIRIIRSTPQEAEVVPNLMQGFGMDEIQAEYVANIKLRHLNKEYIIKRISEAKSLKESIINLKIILDDNSKVDELIINDLNRVASNYGRPRKSILISKEEFEEDEDEIPDYPINLFLSKEGYFKKITPQSLKMNSEQKLKSEDEIVQQIISSNHCDLLFFSDKSKVYKLKAHAFNDMKSSFIGEYMPALLNLDKNEKIIYLTTAFNYSGFMVFFFDSGRVAKVDFKSYYTKTNRKKLVKAYFEGDKLIYCEHLQEEKSYLLKSSSGKILIFNTKNVSLKQTKNTQGILVMKQKKGHRLICVKSYSSGSIKEESFYMSKSLPSSGRIPQELDIFCEQMKLE